MQFLPTRVLSYSYLSEFNSCPRKFELRAKGDAFSREGGKSIDTAFGSAFGAAIAYVLANMNVEPKARLLEANLIAFANWHVGLFEEITSSRKSFGSCLHAIQKFNYTYANVLAKDYEIADINGESSIEYGIGLLLGSSDMNPFLYKGNIDLVLRDKKTGELVVVDLKTSSKDLETLGYMYGKRSQVAMYASILAAALGQSTARLAYIAWNPKEEELYLLPFTMTADDMAYEIESLHARAQVITLYETLARFPHNGDACLAYGRPCKFWGTCKSAPTENLPLEYDTRPYHVISFTELLELQVKYSLNPETQVRKFFPASIIQSIDNSAFTSTDATSDSFDSSLDSFLNPDANTNSSSPDWM